MEEERVGEEVVHYGVVVAVVTRNSYLVLLQTSHWHHWYMVLSCFHCPVSHGSAHCSWSHPLVVCPVPRLPTLWRP